MQAPRGPAPRAAQRSGASLLCNCNRSRFCRWRQRGPSPGSKAKRGIIISSAFCRNLSGLALGNKRMNAADAAWPVATPSADPRGIDSLLFEASPDCVKLLDLDGRLLQMNRNGMCAMEIDDFGPLCGQEWTSLWPEEGRAALTAAVAEARQGRSRRLTAFCPTQKGTPRWWDVTVAPVPAGDGEPQSILSVSRDITELHRARDEQRETVARLGFILASSQLGAWELDLATGAARTSFLHDRCFGYDEPVRNWNYDAFIAAVHPDDRAWVVAAFAQARDTEQDWSFECRVVWPDGSIHWIAVHGSFFRPDGGAAKRILGTVVEITARKQTEAELRETTLAAVQAAEAAETERGRLNALLEATPVGIVYADMHGQLTVSNAAMREIWGDYPQSDSVERYVDWKGWWPDGTPGAGQRLTANDWPLARALQGEEVQGEIVEIEPFGRPDERVTILLRASPVRDAAGEVIGGVVVQQDVTDRMRIERELRDSERRFRTITEAMPQMVWASQSDGYSDYFNRQWYEFTGAAEGESYGDGWMRLLHPDDVERTRQRWEQSRTTGQMYEIEYRLRHRSGDYRWVLARGVPVKINDGDVVRWMGTCTDIHEHRRLLDALGEREEALRLADRRKDEFLAMLAHELRNPLAPISTAAQLLRLAADDPQRVRASAEVIGRQITHLTNLVDDLLDVSRVTRGLVQLDMETLDLSGVVAAAVEQSRPLITARGHALSIRSGPGAPCVQGDRTRLVQVIVNLLNNAAKYTPPGGHITVEVEASDGMARVSVTDNGIGIDKALLPNVFDLFSQGTRTPDRSQGGLGIGLALVRSLVGLHGGRISAESQGANAGSRFTIELPLSNAKPDSGRPIAGQVASVTTPLRVLVVDDNVDAAMLLADVLRMAGHESHAAHNAADAIESAERLGQIDAFILDIGLPDMTGYELATRLRDHPAGERAMYVALTGYGQPHDRVLSRAAGFDHHLVKPADAQKVLGILADVVRRGPARQPG
ncbi:PAS domain S-box protein [Lysobacter korlensis]|uniref:histidine kinase n=1 Tax=Lysobacter korlensis TaxID=553636 RepID=A0ABV6RQW9_9GAMM